MLHPSQLYGVVCIIAHHTCSTPLISPVIVLHSTPLALLTSNSGHTLSYSHIISLLHSLFSFHTTSLYAHVPIFTSTSHVHSPHSTVHTATVSVTTSKLFILPFSTTKSSLSTHVTASLNVHVTVYVAVLLHDNASVVNVTLGASVSYPYTTVHVIVFHSSSANTTSHVISHVVLLAGVTFIPFPSHSALHAAHPILPV